MEVSNSPWLVQQPNRSCCKGDYQFFHNGAKNLWKRKLIYASTIISKLCNQVPSFSLSRWKTLTKEKIKIGWVLWSIKVQICKIIDSCLQIWTLIWNSTQPIHRENWQNFKSPKNGLRRGLDFIAIIYRMRAIITCSWILTIHKDRIFW